MTNRNPPEHVVRLRQSFEPLRSFQIVLKVTGTVCKVLQVLWRLPNRHVHEHEGVCGPGMLRVCGIAGLRLKSPNESSGAFSQSVDLIEPVHKFGDLRVIKRMQQPTYIQLRNLEVHRTALYCGGSAITHQQNSPSAVPALQIRCRHIGTDFVGDGGFCGDGRQCGNNSETMLKKALSVRARYLPSAEPIFLILLSRKPNRPLKKRVEQQRNADVFEVLQPSAYACIAVTRAHEIQSAHEPENRVLRRLDSRAFAWVTVAG